MTKRPKRISSLQDLADIAGVSRATVSRALNDSPLTSAETKAKLQALARKHNYTVNQQARDFRLRQTRVISVVFMLDTHSDQHPSDPFFLEMLGGIADGLAHRDYDLLLAHAPISGVRELANTRIARIARNSDGVIFVGQGEDPEALDDIARSGAHIVVWGEPVADKHYTLVGGDNEIGGYSATAHLLKQGRQRVAFFGNTRTPENRARYAGYKRALSERDKPVNGKLIFEIPSDTEHAQADIVRVISAGFDMDAIVCTSDVMAIAAISALTEKGIRVPQDVAVIGYDDIRMAAYSSPPLTTVRQSIQRAGNVLVESVIALINGQEVADTILESELVIRKSCGGRE